MPAAKPRLRALTEALVPAERSGDFAQALMDLGATLCTPRKPRCVLCPWRDGCAARAAGIAESLPARAEKPERPQRYGVVFWLTRPDGAVLLRRRPEKGLLGGMIEVPTTPWRDEPWGEAEAPGFGAGGGRVDAITRNRAAWVHPFPAGAGDSGRNDDRAVRRDLGAASIGLGDYALPTLTKKAPDAHSPRSA